MLLKNKTIIFLGNARFDGNIKSTSFFIAQNLAKHNKVFFIDYPFTLKDCFTTSFDTKELKLRRRKFSLFSDGRLRTKIKNLEIIVTPPVLPINFMPEGTIFRRLLNFNQEIIARRVKKVLRAEKVSEFIYVNAFNFHYPDIAERINPSLSVYQCVDPMIVPYDMKHGIYSEKQLVAKSDLVICTSKALYLEKSTQNSNTFFIPNGTDLNPKGIGNVTFDRHDKLKSIPRPVIGYLGTIERRINFELITEVIMLNPDKSFVFAGPVSEGFVPEELYKLQNVRFLGTISHQDVEQMISSFDVAIIPFKKDDVSKTIFPIKLFEYLSAGKPVVATDFNEDLKDYTEDCVAYCRTATNFSYALNDMLQKDSEAEKQRRRQLAQKNTWEVRASQFAEILNSHLK
ncbi:glycosyl transferase [Pedobacter quisquiliarum]|uniref:Glycosyl transferase n=1 Tax=Pedobacter quisquiliarum TaxID=1834438 RepID=A0A916XH20_9SPHI|nr:glycosyltransferase [Pedobacter quisquiliarum]GGC71305.1 glycosyl transferase [Pedobacter quisquiliarum]